MSPVMTPVIFSSK